MERQHFDVAVVGAGIVGLSHAWMAARRNLKVLLLERTPVAAGASVRNFGMVWPIGQPVGELRDIALRSRELWLELKTLGVTPIETCGSIHLAHRPDELAVLEEFCSQSGCEAELLTADDVMASSPLANPRGLLGGMFSATELRPNPRIASRQIAQWLSERQGVRCEFGTAVTEVDGRRLASADGRSWSADRIIVCSGSDLLTLFPAVLATSGLKLCKLQMLKSVPQPNSPPGSPHLASGLTLRHYTSFQGCPSLAALRARIASETPELDQFGIHVMASPFPTGEVILGDSHEYGDDITPFDKQIIDDLMLRELQKVFRLADWGIQERWHGIYAKHPHLPIFTAEPIPNVHVRVGPGGAGMTMSFGLADRDWKHWMGEN